MKKQFKQQMRILLLMMISGISSNSLGLVTYDQKADVNALRQIADGAKRHTEQVRQWKDQAMHWKQTLEHYTNHENTLKSQLASFTGVRNIGDLEGQIDSLISEMDGIERNRSMFTEFLGSSDPKINNEANQILNKYQIFDTCQKKGSTRLDNICKEEILNKAGTIETGEKINRKMKHKVREVQMLSHKAAKSSNIKESQDIANAIAIKQAEINLKIQGLSRTKPINFLPKSHWVFYNQKSFLACYLKSQQHCQELFVSRW